MAEKGARKGTEKGTSGKREPVTVGGVFAALATPRRPNSIEADTGALLDYLDAVAVPGINGLVLFGSTGEFVHFELEERMRATGLAIKRSRVPVLVNASHSTLAGAILLGQHAKGAGAAGVLLTPPYFYRYSEDQICEFYLQFVDAMEAGTGVYLYNLPTYINPISAALAGRLFGTGAFAGIKDSSGDWNLFDSLLNLPERVSFRLLAGNESIYLRTRSAGADGIVSGIAAALPELMVALDHAIFARDDARAQALNEKLAEFLSYVERFPSTTAIRQAAVVRGWKLGNSAVPLDEDTAADVIRFQGWFREWLPGTLAECGQITGVRT